MQAEDVQLRTAILLAMSCIGGKLLACYNCPAIPSRFSLELQGAGRPSSQRMLGLGQIDQSAAHSL